ncbi:MAG: secretin N-terminal domain-containing protein [Candidatus Omnitrophota bacterium]
MKKKIKDKKCFSQCYCEAAKRPKQSLLGLLHCARNDRRQISLFLLATCYLLLATSAYAQDEIIPLVKFRDVEIKTVVRSLAEKAFKEGRKVNIVVNPNVEGLVTVKLENVSWQDALGGILKAHNYGYRWIEDSIILVDTLEQIQEREKVERELQEVEVPRTKVFRLRYIDANDTKKAIEPMLSAIGRVSVLEMTGQAGWEFGTEATKRERSEGSAISRTKTLLVSDTSKALKDIEALIKQIDIMPKQILIKTRIMEVNRDFLQDIGFDWGTGTTGASSSSLTFNKFNDAETKSVAAHALTTQVTPSLFGAASSSITPSNTGLKLAFRKLAGDQFEAILHALEEDGRTNTLSAPVILTLDNQEASMLVGQKYPIVKTETSAETSQITGGSLDYYQDIGIQLNVVPQICGENDEYINMIIHPAVTARLQDISVTDTEGTTLVSYPWLTSRETETQVIVKDGETVVIGGLLKDVKSRQEIGVPILSKLPVIGWLFKRYTSDTAKIDLMIFITASIVEPGDVIPQQVYKTKRVTSKFEK